MKHPLALSATLLLTASALTAGLVGGGAAVANASVIPDARAMPVAEGASASGSGSGIAEDPGTDGQQDDSAGPTDSSQKDKPSGVKAQEASEDPTSEPTSCEGLPQKDERARGLELVEPKSDSGTYGVVKYESDKPDQNRAKIAECLPDDLHGLEFTINRAHGHSKSLTIHIGKPGSDDSGLHPMDGEPADEPKNPLYDTAGGTITKAHYTLEQGKAGDITFTEKKDPSTPTPTHSGGGTPTDKPTDTGKPTTEPTDPGPAPTTSPSDPPGDGDDDNPVPEPTTKPSHTPSQGSGPGDPNNGNGNGASPEQTGGAGDAQGDYSDPVPRGPDASENPDEINDKPDTDGDGWDTGKPTASATSTQAGDGQLTSGLGPLPWSLAAVVGLGALAIVLAFLVLGRRKRKDSE